MAVTSLAVKYRPKTFDDLCEQDYIKAVLKNQINTKSFVHAYLFTGPAGCGKAQPMYSKILTPDGYIDMRNVQIGTKVFTREGNVTEVTEIYPQGKRPIYEITLQDRTKIRVADNHLNSVFRYNQDKKIREDFVLETTELIEFLKTSRFKLRVDVPSVDWDYKDVLIDPYLLGLLIGDGSLSEGNFGFSNIEDDILNKVGVLLEDNYGMCLRKHKNYAPADYDICYIMNPGHNGSKGDRGRFSIKRNFDLLKTLKGQLDHYGLLCKSVDKHIPKEYLYNTREVRIALLRGLFDADGYIGNGGPTVVFNTSSEQLSEDFAFLVRSLGIRDTVSKKHSGYKNGRGEYINCRDTYEHYLHVPNNLQFFTSSKHKERFSFRQNYPIRNIVSIDYVGEEECQCIMVSDEDHTYISDDFIPTHNTTSARIFAMDLNEGKGTPIEVDAASNTGVDNIRIIIDDSKKRALDSEYKTFIIDECHMLSNGAWNAMLKLLEEPPAKTIFIMCTTDPQKIPATILSRVQRYDFIKIPTEVIEERLRYIVSEENKNSDSNYDVDDDVYSYIAKLAAGGMRDAITMLDKCLALSNNLDVVTVSKVLGTVDYDVMFLLLDNMLRGKSALDETLDVIDDVFNSGADMKTFIKQFMFFVKDVCKIKIFNSFSTAVIPKTEEYEEKISDIDIIDCIKCLEFIMSVDRIVKWDSSPRDMLESLVIMYECGCKYE